MKHAILMVMLALATGGAMGGTQPCSDGSFAVKKQTGEVACQVPSSAGPNTCRGGVLMWRNTVKFRGYFCMSEAEARSLCSATNQQMVRAVWGDYSCSPPDGPW
jgi:hypothetical protein